ncbi:MAG: TetR/AcrR family transcriptional regulator C-terminal domain-containing protein [Actinomycetota bacterium]
MTATNTPESARQPLTREAIVAAAIALADVDGVGQLSMRKLARSLGFEVMSLYNHVANKNELLSAMVDAVTAEIAPPPADAAPLDAVRAIAVATRAMLVEHQWAASLWQQHLPGPIRIAFMERLLELLHDSNLSPEMAHHGFHAIPNHVFGYTLQELDMTMGDDDPAATIAAFLDGLSPTEHPFMIAHVQQHVDGDTAPSFELVLDLILDGLQRRSTR